MKQFLIGVFILISYISINAQTLLFDTNTSNLSDLSDEESTQFSKLLVETNVDEIYSIDIVEDILDSDRISFKVGNDIIAINLLKKNIRSEKNYSWFGKTDEGEGVFFCVNNGKFASKFSIGEYAYTLIPINSGHALVKFNSTYVGECGTTNVTEPASSSFNITESESKISSINDNILDDSECTLRILVATTAAARQRITNIGFDIPTFVQLAVDESNMAYISSEINITMELAALIETDYEVTHNAFFTDLNNLEDGTNGAESIHIAMEYYQTDIQVLIADNAGIFGRAAYVPNGVDELDVSQAFCIATVNGIFLERFTFTHKIAHLQGAGHDDREGDSFGRGLISSDTDNAWRTIMGTSDGCNEFAGCRIGNFSNPDINGPDDIPTGSEDRNNARMLNETALTISNFRTVPDILLLTDRTVASNEVSNHLAHSTIDTDNQDLTYERGSLSTMRADERIFLRPGTYIKQGAKFRAYLTKDPCESLLDFRNTQNISDNATSNEQLSDLTVGDLELKIYPNPTYGTIHLQFNTTEESKYQVKLYDLLSNTYLDKYYEKPNVHLDLNFLSEGIYFFEINKNNTQMIKRIIKK